MLKVTALSVLASLPMSVAANADCLVWQPHAPLYCPLASLPRLRIIGEPPSGCVESSTETWVPSAEVWTWVPPNPALPRITFQLGTFGDRSEMTLVLKLEQQCTIQLV